MIVIMPVLILIIIVIILFMVTTISFIYKISLSKAGRGCKLDRV